MRNTIRLIGIIAFIVIIGFSIIACDDNNGNGNGGGGGGSSGGENPDPTCAQTMKCYIKMANDDQYYASSYKDCEDMCAAGQAIAGGKGEYTCNCE
jgi:hypothetical protein